MKGVKQDRANFAHSEIENGRARAKRLEVRPAVRLPSTVSNLPLERPPSPSHCTGMTPSHKFVQDVVKLRCPRSSRELSFLIWSAISDIIP